MAAAEPGKIRAKTQAKPVRQKRQDPDPELELDELRHGLAEGASNAELYEAASILRRDRPVVLAPDIVSALQRITRTSTLSDYRLRTIWTLVSALHRILIRVVRDRETPAPSLVLAQQAMKVLAELNVHPRVQADRPDNPDDGIQGPIRHARRWLEEGLKASIFPDDGQGLDPDVDRLRPEAVTPHSDEPTAEDELNRRPFARALVERMDTVHGQGGVDGFAVNIHAPWGAGKTSVLHMMEDIMTETLRPTEARWAVGTFNAWKHEHRHAPWWPFMVTVRKALVTAHRRNGQGWTALRIWWSWWWRRALFGFAPYLVAALLFAGVVGGLMWADLLPRTHAGAIDWTKSIGVPGAILAALVAFGGLSRGLIFGNKDQAQFYFGLTRDPWRRVKSLFRSMVGKSKRPVCLFIDDLDRCRSPYVVDLLTGVQTHFRHRNMTYVVAADRTWIRASFEKYYETFKAPVSEPGQPLGYLFLEKIFQISTPIPGMGQRRRRTFWQNLLVGGRRVYSIPSEIETIVDPAPKPVEKIQFTAGLGLAGFEMAVERERKALQAQFAEGLTRKAADRWLEGDADNETKRAAVALELSRSGAASEEIRHALAQFADILPDNPRVMKRMINAYSMRQAIGILEHDALSAGTLARWTILEQRFPEVADWLADRPAELGRFSARPGTNLDTLPERLRDRTLCCRVASVVGEGEPSGLTESDIRSLTRGAAA